MTQDVQVQPSNPSQSSRVLLIKEINGWARNHGLRTTFDIGQEDRQELWECFSALAVDNAGEQLQELTWRELAKAADIVLGPGKYNVGSLKTALVEMDLNHNGSISWPEWRAYMSTNWSAAKSADQVLGSNGQEDMITLGVLDGTKIRLVDLVKHYRRKLIMERFLKGEALQFSQVVWDNEHKPPSRTASTRTVMRSQSKSVRRVSIADAEGDFIIPFHNGKGVPSDDVTSPHDTAFSPTARSQDWNRSTSFSRKAKGLRASLDIRPGNVSRSLSWRNHLSGKRASFAYEGDRADLEREQYQTSSNGQVQLPGSPVATRQQPELSDVGGGTADAPPAMHTLSSSPSKRLQTHLSNGSTLQTKSSIDTAACRTVAVTPARLTQQESSAFRNAPPMLSCPSLPDSLAGHVPQSLGISSTLSSPVLTARMSMGQDSARQPTKAAQGQEVGIGRAVTSLFTKVSGWFYRSGLAASIPPKPANPTTPKSTQRKQFVPAVADEGGSSLVKRAKSLSGK